MSIYDAGTASLSADGTVTGVGTTWRQPLTLIRVGATMIFNTTPASIVTIAEILSDTEIRVFNDKGFTAPAGTQYSILAHDGITVQGLAQDVAETLRYYQSRETEVATAVDAFNQFDADEFQQNINTVNSQFQQVSRDAAQVSADRDQVSSYAASAQQSAISAEDSAFLATSAAESVSGALIGSFQDGVTLQSRTQQILNILTNEVTSYVWDGSFPKVVPAGSTPESTGGIGAGSWINVGDALLRSQLNSSTGTSYVNHSGRGFQGASVYQYLSWKNGDISAFGGVYGDPLASSLNKVALQSMEDLFGGVNINLMGSSLYFPDDMNLSVSYLNIWGNGEIYAGDGYNFYLKPGGYFNAEEFTAHGSPDTLKRPRLVGVPDGVLIKIKSIKATKFKTIGRIELFSAIAPLNVNPEDVNYGCESISLTHFNSESPYDFILITRDFPIETVEVSNFKIHNMAGTFIQIGAVNENAYEQQIRAAMKNVSIHDYSIINDDSFWADGSNGYTAVALVTCWSLNHYNGYQKGVKCRSPQTLEMYDIYNKAWIVQENDITIEDCMGWNSCLMVPHKIKEAHQYSSTNKRWFYRRNYVRLMQQMFPDITLKNSRGTFFFTETRDWVGSPQVGPLVYGNRFIHIHNCDIELITLNYVANGTPLTNVSVTGCHFSSPANTSTNFVRASVYPYNLRQQITVTDNTFDLPDALVHGIVQLNTGSQGGGGGFTGTLDISRNRGLFGDLTVLTDYASNNNQYANMNLIMDGNIFNSKARCRLSNPFSNPSQYDAGTCTGNILSGTELDCGYLWNASGINRVSYDGISSSNQVLFRVGLPGVQRISTGTRYISVASGADVPLLTRFTVGVSGSATTISFTDSAGIAQTYSTGTDNGTYTLNLSGVTSDFTIVCDVSSSEIVVRTSSTGRRRFVFTGYSV